MDALDVDKEIQYPLTCLLCAEILAITLPNYAELSFAYREGMIVPMTRNQLRED